MRSFPLLGLAVVPGAFGLCPPPGPLLPPPIVKQNTFTIPNSAFENLPFLSDTTFSIQARVGDKEVFEYSHAAPGYHDSATPLRSTKLRIASVTKLYTALAIKLSADKIGWDDPIGKFVPELSGNKAYKDVTIASLAGHTSGLGRFGYVGDLATVPGFNPALLGISPVNMTLPGCDPYPGARVCNHDELIAMFNAKEYSPTSVNTHPLYSNVAFVLLGLALEKVHSKKYEQVIQDLIFTPLKLANTTFAVPTDRNTTLLPNPGDSWFVPDYFNYNPTGGIWSTPDDMMTFMRAISKNSLLSAAETRKWMQPSSVLPSVQQLVGAPWEIFRPTTTKVSFSRPIDIYTKAGGVKGYSGYGILIPEFDIAVTINAAGNSSYNALVAFLPLVTQPLIEYADQLARDQAKEKYAGIYTLPGSNNTITLSVDDGPGLAISNFNMNGVPVLQTFAALQGIPAKDFSARLYPTDPDSLGTGKEIWTINLDRITTAPSFADMACNSWNGGDPYRYMKERIDTFVFEVKEKKVKSVELKGWRTVLKK